MHVVLPKILSCPLNERVLDFVVMILLRDVTSGMSDCFVCLQVRCVQMTESRNAQKIYAFLREDVFCQARVTSVILALVEEAFETSPACALSVSHPRSRIRRIIRIICRSSVSDLFTGYCEMPTRETSERKSPQSSLSSPCDFEVLDGKSEICFGVFCSHFESAQKLEFPPGADFDQHHKSGQVSCFDSFHI